MIQILIDSNPLDMEPDAATEFQQISPFFDENQISGEYSLPVNISCTERNLRLLGYVNELAAVRDHVKINTVTWAEDGMPLYRGTLITESVNSGIVNPAGKISAYFVCGVSNFWQKIKGKNMRDLDLGGKVDRSAYPSFSDFINASLNGDSSTWNFVFAPIYNAGWAGEYDDTLTKQYEWMNPPGIEEDDSTHYHVFIRTRSRSVSGPPYLDMTGTASVAMPYLIFILKKIFEEHGYQVNGDIFNDTQFKKIIIPNFNGISTWEYSTIENGHRVFHEKSDDLYLSKCMPDMSIGDFLISLRNKVGFGFQFARNKNTCTLISLMDIIKNSKRIDYSKKVNPSFKINITKEKVYALTQSFDSGDASINEPDLSKLNYIGAYDNWQFIIFPTEEPNYFLWLPTNQFYRSIWNEDTEIFEWKPFADNIFDYKPEGSTNSVESKATCMRMKKSIVGLIDAGQSWASIYEYLPWCDQQGNWLDPVSQKSTAYTPWGLRLMFYYGMKEKYIFGTNKHLKIPFTSNSNYFDDQKIGEWSLSYRQDGDGLFDKFWKGWIEILQSNEEVDFTLYPALHEMMNLEWSDIILIKSVPYLLKQRNPQSPYNGEMKVKAVRIPL